MSLRDKLLHKQVEEQPVEVPDSKLQVALEGLSDFILANDPKSAMAGPIKLGVTLLRQKLKGVDQGVQDRFVTGLSTIFSKAADPATSNVDYQLWLRGYMQEIVNPQEADVHA